jgi:hypothetical protein
MPGEQRRRGHREHFTPSAAGDEPGQCCEPLSVGRLVADPSGLAAAVLRSRAGAPGVRRPWAPHARQHDQAAEQTACEQVGDGEDHSAMISTPGRPPRPCQIEYLTFKSDLRWHGTHRAILVRLETWRMRGAGMVARSVRRGHGAEGAARADALSRWRDVAAACGPAWHCAPRCGRSARWAPTGRAVAAWLGCACAVLRLLLGLTYSFLYGPGEVHG